MRLQIFDLVSRISPDCNAVEHRDGRLVGWSVGRFGQLVGLVGWSVGQLVGLVSWSVWSVGRLVGWSGGQLFFGVLSFIGQE